MKRTPAHRGSSAWSGKHEEIRNTPQGSLTLLTKGGRIIFASDLEPVHTRLERSPTGPRLVIESETFGAILPASPFILELLAAKLKGVASA
jgi:hypothetical protein